MTRQEKWDLRFLKLAQIISEWSKDTGTKCGAVIVRPDMTIASTGYNGFPRGMRDDIDLYLDKEKKYSRVIHSEVNALLTAKEPLQGYTLYGWPFTPCDRCAVQIIQAGIKRVVFAQIPDNGSSVFKTQGMADLAGQYFQEAGVSVRVYPWT